MRLFCKHVFQPIDATRGYDYFGYRVVVISYKCLRCGTVRLKKYW